ncbi:MAG: septum formation initiator family protein [Dysgonamonadaceae bacterium]|jgi:cell division protein FtsB|nr:septum formation initiator family protein [Dysgonamonadaceae bacterium]
MKNIVALVPLVKSKLNKYWIVVVVGFVLTFLVGEHNIFNRLSYNRQINRLRSEIEYYTQQKELNLQKLQELHSDNESLEKLAREQYKMVKPDEELFIIKE